jgi:hypothetical protein
VQGIHPFSLDVAAPAHVARWRPLVNWLLVVPHQLWLYVLQLGAQIVAVIAWFAILLTGRQPDSWSDYIVGVLRYQWRVTAYLYGWADRYPDFVPPAGLVDPGDYPAVLYCARPVARNRLTVLLRIVLIVPHLVAVGVVGVAATAALVVGWFAVLVTGRWPEGLRNFVVGWFRWSFRVQAYGYLVTDAYPPFGFGA